MADQTQRSNDSENPDTQPEPSEQTEQFETEEQVRKRVLGTGATGDVENPEAGGPWTGTNPQAQVPAPGETPRVENAPEPPAPEAAQPGEPTASTDAGRLPRRGAQPTDPAQPNQR